MHQCACMAHHRHPHRHPRQNNTHPWRQTLPMHAPVCTPGTAMRIPGARSPICIHQCAFLAHPYASLATSLVDVCAPFCRRRKLIRHPRHNHSHPRRQTLPMHIPVRIPGTAMRIPDARSLLCIHQYAFLAHPYASLASSLLDVCAPFCRRRQPLVWVNEDANYICVNFV